MKYVRLGENVFPMSEQDIEMISPIVLSGKGFLNYCPHTLVQCINGVIKVSLDGNTWSGNQKTFYEALCKAS